MGVADRRDIRQPRRRSRISAPAMRSRLGRLAGLRDGLRDREQVGEAGERAHQAVTVDDQERRGFIDLYPSVIEPNRLTWFARATCSVTVPFEPPASALACACTRRSTLDFGSQKRASPSCPAQPRVRRPPARRTVRSALGRRAAGSCVAVVVLWRAPRRGRVPRARRALRALRGGVDPAAPFEGARAGRARAPASPEACADLLCIVAAFCSEVATAP